MCCNQNETTRGCPGGCSSSESSGNGVFINPIPRYIAGPIGPQGPQGEQGIQGLQGEQGPQGEPGECCKAECVRNLDVDCATVRGNAEKINEILAALRAAGLMET